MQNHWSLSVEYLYIRIINRRQSFPPLFNVYLLNHKTCEVESEKTELPGGAHRDSGHDGALGQVVHFHPGVEAPPAHGDGLRAVLEKVRPHGQVIVVDVLLPVEAVQPEVELGPICKVERLL